MVSLRAALTATSPTSSPHDVLAIGNHELYLYPITLDMSATLISSVIYLSHIIILVTDKKTGNLGSIPVGARYRKFETLRGGKVTAFGVLFNFKGNAADTSVEPLEDMVNETGFKTTTREDPNLFPLVGLRAKHLQCHPICPPSHTYLYLRRSGSLVSMGPNAHEYLVLIFCASLSLWYSLV
ncbi:hypothetical protein BS47DRAFT_25095 [Hydnum rufescens UP504]|uniref:Uncharacterized protein n=1 Tax=Hydnum rufescens UP504 TaxID=1448309 RepID=A0A9P6B7R6_9AGAM|nr:hypothetical protein BS47DRAFT_25095 [Hydnum rufescens UP504]